MCCWLLLLCMYERRMCVRVSFFCWLLCRECEWKWLNEHSKPISYFGIIVGFSGRLVVNLLDWQPDGKKCGEKNMWAIKKCRVAEQTIISLWVLCVFCALSQTLYSIKWTGNSIQLLLYMRIFVFYISYFFGAVVATKWDNKMAKQHTLDVNVNYWWDICKMLQPNQKRAQAEEKIYWWDQGIYPNIYNMSDFSNFHISITMETYCVCVRGSALSTLYQLICW